MQFFSDSFKESIYEKFINYTVEYVNEQHREFVFFYSKNFFEAIKEADFDACFMRERRGLEKGISEGKVAGALYFRLTRHKVIHLAKNLFEIEDYKNLQEKVSADIVCTLLKIDLKSNWVFNLQGTKRTGGTRLLFQDLYSELIYLTSKRHYNQESLALFFDACAYLSHSLDEIKGYKSAIDGMNRAIQNN